MENNESNKELLLPRNDINPHFKYATILKWIIKITMWISFVFWAVLIFMYPLQSSESLIEKWTNSISSSFLGFTGSAFVIFGGPVVVISLLSATYIVLDSVQEDLPQCIETEARFRMGTFPVLVKGGFRVISAAEMIGIMVFGLYLIWVASVYSIQKLAHVFSDPEYTTTSQKWSEFLRLCGKGCGLAGLVSTSFMIITITRGSTILRIVNIHSQQAIRYHIWLSHLSLSLFTLHAFLYLFGWFLIGGIPSKMILWQSTEVAHLPGVINILFCWIIWITSISFIRTNYFELFYFTHYLYILFIVFLAMHIGNFFFCIVAGPVFLFIVDYFLRLFQCQKKVDVIAATCFPCDVVQLVMPITPNLKHNALCTLWIRVKEISSTQWHPFSVTTTTLDGRCRISVLIKASGNWTSQLKHKFLNHPDPINLNVSIEGPYGYCMPDYLRFENLILVAGGIGISPFMAVLSDIIHRMCRPVNIVLIWTVKTSHHLSLLSTIDMETRSSQLMNLQIMIYVTQELHPPSENKILQTSITSAIYPSSKRNVIYDIASSGHKIWLATYIISSTFGFVTITSIINILYIRPYEVTTWWFQALLLLGSMVAGVSIFGGGVIGLWSVREKKNYLKDVKEIDEEQSNDHARKNNSFFEYFSSSTTFHYGSRPYFKEIFGTFGNSWGQADVGVIACGPNTLEESVARECRSLNLRRKSDQPIFHFSCHSFSL